MVLLSVYFLQLATDAVRVYNRKAKTGNDGRQFRQSGRWSFCSCHNQNGCLSPFSDQDPFVVNNDFMKNVQLKFYPYKHIDRYRDVYLIQKPHTGCCWPLNSAKRISYPLSTFVCHSYSSTKNNEKLPFVARIVHRCIKLGFVYV